MEPQIVQGLDLVTFNTTEAQTLGIKPGVYSRNPLAPGGSGLLKIIDNVHEYKMLHLSIPENVLVPQSGCSTWSPSQKAYLQNDKIECAYWEVNEELCPDEFLASCLHNISSKNADVLGVMTNSSQPISAITAAIIVGLQTAIGDSTHRIGFFADPNFGAGSYHSAAKVNYLHKRSTSQKDRLVNMLNKQEGLDTVLRRRVGSGRIPFVNTNDGVGASTNATLPANIKGFLQDMIRNSSNVLRYWKRYGGRLPVFYLQSGLYRALLDYYATLPGGQDNRRFLVDGVGVDGVYDFEGYPVVEWVDADIFDSSVGLTNPATGHSWNQRALFTVPDNLTLITNVRASEGLGAGLAIQTSPLLIHKGKTWMYMTYGIGAGIAYNDLCTYGYNTSYTYPTS